MKSYHITYVLDAHTTLPPFDEVNEALCRSGSDTVISASKISTSTLDAEAVAEGDSWSTLDSSDFILLMTHGSIAYFKQFNRFKQKYADKKMIFIYSTMPDEMAEMMLWLRVSVADGNTILKYIKCKNTTNLINLNKFIASHYGGIDIDYAPPVIPQWEGLYITDELETNYLAEVRKAKDAGCYVVGVLIPYHLYADKNLRHIDALITALNSAGTVVIPIYTTASKDNLTGEKGVTATVQEYFYDPDGLLVDVVVNTLGYSLGIFEESGSIWMEKNGTSAPSLLARMNIPVIQAYYTYFSYEQWKESVQGLDAFSLVSAVYYPEFDGQIDGYPIGCRDMTHPQEITIAPMAEGIDIVSRLAYRWAKLQYTPNAEKKVAIIFHNMPPRNDMIGCAAGLDSPASVYNLLHSLEAMGVSFDNHYKNGDDIIRRIISAVSNDDEWLSDEELMKRATDTIPAEAYQRWHDELEPETKAFLEKDWGASPGTFKVVDGAMPVPGILNGNVFIGLQPPRGYEQQAEAVYHSTDIACPHFYIAIYKWIRHVFNADVVVHIGTHGTLEWLPGKEKALSKACLPQTNIDDMPHLYLYHTSVIGEGIQAKRRASAVLLNHLEPVSTESGTYDELSELDELVHKYITAPMTKAQHRLCEESILAMVQKLHMDQDLGLDVGNVTDAGAYITKVHNWLGVIKRSMVKDGLHIFGEAPSGSRLNDFVRVLLRVSGSNCLSMDEALALYYGFPIEVLRLIPDKIWNDGSTSVMILDRFTAVSRRLVEALNQNRFNPLDEARCRSILGDGVGSMQAVQDIMQVVHEQIYPKLCDTTNELKAFEKGITAQFILPGKGGSPSRGNLDILPTGRNMYALDPNEIPSHVAYKIGSKLGEQLLEKYLKNDDTYPESIAIVLYSGDQMRTYGEDIAEILWLMGLKPVWMSDSSDKVTGLEVIPLDVLQRPRIDVVSRISGLLRDTFPSIISLLDDAVKMVVSLNEPHEMNYVKKHFDEDILHLREQGIDSKLAEQHALVRVFGCPPGNYGGGVDVLVENKNWSTDDDLATAAITWAAHAYSGDFHGQKCRDNLERQLSKVTATVKNENTIDFDLYDIDDEFIYHGGLIAAVKKCSGKAPQSFYGNSSDPSFTVVRSVKEESARVMRSRLLNPIWIEGLKRHGYKGAQDVAYNMDNIFGWDAVADIVEDWNYEALAQHLLGNADHKEWLREANPWALREIAEKLLEASQRGMWHAQPETLELVEKVYLECEGLMEGD
ncbi:cobaltochelatase subunit CobN [Porphyromonas pogonae]|uniref:cobaltochelatase subunit CobN n=1 Tax=Porphyromonas pogonae TaxID=867595 RepID=UPI002E7950EE|nr:cobaltochelatase subunit CobN [Porphyromonas pogonae]